MFQKMNRQSSDTFLVIGLFFLSNISAFFDILWLRPESVFFHFGLWFLFAAFCIWVLRMQTSLSGFIENLKRNWIVLPFLIYSGLSIFWSIYWEISLLRWLILIGTIIAAGFIGMQHDMKRIINLLSIFGIYVLLLSAMLVFLIPNIGVMNYYIIQGAWKGLYWHKNHMGLIASFISILFLLRIMNSYLSKRLHIIFWAVLYLFSLLFIYKSASVAAYITTVILHGLLFLGLIFLKYKNQIRRNHYLVIGVVVILSVLILFLKADYIFGLFNRNTTLTGRVPMWTYLFEAYIAKRAFFGYGFNAFWYLAAHRVAMQLAAGYPDPIVISDNGFIDILVNTGYTGLILFLIFYLGAWWRSTQYALQAKDINGIFPLIVMAFTLLANVSWSLMFENEGFFMLIMLSLLFSISNGTSKAREG
jgi:exopolysaccharide production protein ExoQ